MRSTRTAERSRTDTFLLELFPIALGAAGRHFGLLVLALCRTAAGLAGRRATLLARAGACHESANTFAHPNEPKSSARVESEPENYVNYDN